MAVAVEADGAETLAVFIDNDRVHEVRASVARKCGVAPRFVIPVETFPTGETGKVDRAALRKLVRREWPYDLRMQPAAVHATQDERARATHIANVMAVALDVPAIALEENFFACGGTSLRVVQTAAQLECEPADLFHAPTPLALAARLSRRAEDRTPRRRKIARGSEAIEEGQFRKQQAEVGGEARHG